MVTIPQQHEAYTQCGHASENCNGMNKRHKAFTIANRTGTRIGHKKSKTHKTPTFLSRTNKKKEEELPNIISFSPLWNGLVKTGLIKGRWCQEPMGTKAFFDKTIAGPQDEAIPLQRAAKKKPIDI